MASLAPDDNADKFESLHVPPPKRPRRELPTARIAQPKGDQPSVPQSERDAAAAVTPKQKEEASAAAMDETKPAGEAKPVKAAEGSEKGTAVATPQDSAAAAMAPPSDGSQNSESKGVGIETEQEEPEIFSVSSQCWAHVAQLEKAIYTAKGYSGYVPGSSPSITTEKLREAVLEFARRYNECDDDSNYSAVLVSSNVKESPDRDEELAALEGTGISKVWYCLTQEGDLLIIKISSRDVQSKCVHRILYYVQAFCDQYPRIFDPDGDGEHVLQSGDIKAPDAFMQPRFPLQAAAVPTLLSPLIVEFEHKHRGPKALLQILSSYFLVTPVVYCLGIKVYDRSGPVAAAGQRPFAAVACLWRRHPTNQNRAQVVGFWSFGSRELSGQAKAAFKKRRGILDPIPQAMLVHPATQRAIVIPAADLVQNQVDENGNAVPVLQTGNDLTIDLDDLADICNRRLVA